MKGGKTLAALGLTLAMSACSAGMNGMAAGGVRPAVAQHLTRARKILAGM